VVGAGGGGGGVEVGVLLTTEEEEAALDVDEGATTAAEDERGLQRFEFCLFLTGRTGTSIGSGAATRAARAWW